MPFRSPLTTYTVLPNTLSRQSGDYFRSLSNVNCTRNIWNSLGRAALRSSRTRLSLSTAPRSLRSSFSYSPFRLHTPFSLNFQFLGSSIKLPCRSSAQTNLAKTCSRTVRNRCPVYWISFPDRTGFEVATSFCIAKSVKRFFDFRRNLGKRVLVSLPRVHFENKVGAPVGRFRVSHETKGFATKHRVKRMSHHPAFFLATCVSSCLYLYLQFPSFVIGYRPVSRSHPRMLGTLERSVEKVTRS